MSNKINLAGCFWFPFRKSLIHTLPHSSYNTNLHPVNQRYNRWAAAIGDDRVPTGCSEYVCNSIII